MKLTRPQIWSWRMSPSSASLTSLQRFADGVLIGGTSESTGEQVKLKKILLNGNNICMVCIFFPHPSMGAFPTPMADRVGS